ncbi:hypothetical protein BVY01_02825 [bacterium I07]|nr:hypothetical protein BVY01_02825 [bacterium I07]
MAYLLKFFLRDGLHSRRTLWLALLGFVPVGCAVLLWLLKAVLRDFDISLSTLFPQVSFAFYLHFLLPLMSIFIGSAVIADEVEERTLPYLLTRPVARPVFMLAKILTGVLTAGFILFISLGMTYTIMVLDKGFGGWLSDISMLFRSGAVIVLGLLVYVPLFGIFGGLLKRPVLLGFLFAFGWEGSVAFLPGNVKLLTVVHYLHVLFPQMKKVQLTDARTILNILVPAREVSAGVAVLILIVLAALFIVLCAALPSMKEYRLERE